MATTICALDIQSLINSILFSGRAIAGLAKDEGFVCAGGGKRARWPKRWAGLIAYATLEEVQAWPLGIFCQRRPPDVVPQPRQEPDEPAPETAEPFHVGEDAAAHSRRPSLRHAGGRGATSGYQGLDVPRGHIHIDDKRGTARVNDEDWLVAAGFPKNEGIAGILGGLTTMMPSGCILSPTMMGSGAGLAQPQPGG